MLIPQRNTKPFRRNGTADRGVPLAMKAEIVGDDADDSARIRGQRAIAGTPGSDQPQTIPLPTWSPMISAAKSPCSRRYCAIAMGGGTSRAIDAGFARRGVLRASARIRHCTDAKHSVA